VAAVKYAAENLGCEVFNLGTGVGYSVLDMVTTFQEVNHVPLPYKIVERRPGDVAINYADPRKSERLLKWKAQYNLADMCRDSWHWQSSNPTGYAD
jgi:UDP-glucose 4-epimerase